MLARIVVDLDVEWIPKSYMVHEAPTLKLSGDSNRTKTNLVVEWTPTPILNGRSNSTTLKLCIDRSCLTVSDEFTHHKWSNGKPTYPILSHLHS